MKLHLPSGLRAALMACFAVVSTVVAPPISATMAGGVAAVSFLCVASSAMADSVTWDANWNVTDAPSDIVAPNILTDIANQYTFLSAEGSVHYDPQTEVTAVILESTAPSASEVNVMGGAGATQSVSASEGDLNADTWMMVTGGTYTTIAGGNYAQNYLGGEPANFAGNTHIMLKEASGSTLTVRDIIGGNFMEAQNATFTGNSYISVMDGTVNGSIVGAGISGHNQTSTFTGNSSVWVYTPLASSSSGAETDAFPLPSNIIVGGSAGIHNANPKIVLKGNSSVTVDLSSYVSDGSSVEMGKTIIGDAWLQGGSTSTHTGGNAAVSIKGEDAGGSAVTFSAPVVAGSYFAGNGSATLEGNTSLTVDGGTFSGALVGGACMAADSEQATSFTMKNASISLADGTFNGNIIGGSWVSEGTGVATQQTGDITLAVSGGSVSGTIYGGSYNQRNNAESIANHGNINIVLTGGEILGSVYAGGGVSAGSAGSVKAESTQVEVGNGVVLGNGTAITISGGVQNSTGDGWVSGDRTLLFSGSNAYTNLSDVTFHGFNVVNNAGDASIVLQEAGSSFTKEGVGTLTITGSNLNPIADLSVEAGVLDTDTASLNQGGTGLSSISIGEGALLKTAALTLKSNATLALDVTNAVASTALIAVGGDFSAGETPTLALTLKGVESLAGGSSVSLLSWGNTGTEEPLTLAGINWTNKPASGMEAFELSIENKSLILTRAEAQEWNSSGTWQTGSSSEGKAATFSEPTAGDATISILGDVEPQSIVVTNSEAASYTFEADAAGGSITGDTGLTKNGDGTLIIELANTYTGGTTINGGTVEAAVAGADGSALGTGAVMVNAGATLLASAEDAVALNAIELNGGTLSYSEGETRQLGTAGITHTADEIPDVSVAEDKTVTWQDADGSNIQAAMGTGIILRGGGTLVAEATDAGADIVLNGPITLVGEDTTLTLGSMGSKQMGTDTAPVLITLGVGTTLRVEQPQTSGTSTLRTELNGEGTLEFAAAVGADNAVQLMGDNDAFEGSINLGAEGAAASATPATAPAVLLDYSMGSPVGGENSELNLNGLAFATVNNGGTETTTAADIYVNSDTTQFAQTAGLNNTFSGDVMGDAESTWTLDSTLVDGGQTNTLTGDLSGFDGTLEATGKEGSIARWVLSDDTSTVAAFALDPDTVIDTDLNATNQYNEFVLDYAEEVTLAGLVSGQANLTQQGAGTLVLTGDNTSSGTLLIAEGSTVQLGTEDDAGQWGVAAGSSLAGNGTLVLANGALGGPLTVAAGSTPVVAVDATAGATINMNGNAASLLNGSITMDAGSTLTGVGTGSISGELNMTLAAANIGANAAGTAMVQFVNDGAGSTLGSTTENIYLNLSMNDVVARLREHRVTGTLSYLTLTNGELITATDYSNVNFGSNTDILDYLGLRIEGKEGGSLILSGTAEGVYIAGEGEDPTDVTGYQYFGGYQAVAVMGGETLTLTLDGAPNPSMDGAGSIINNLLGGEDSALEVDNTSDTETAVVILNNSVQVIDPTPEGLPGSPAGPNTTFAGDIGETLLGGDVEFVKTGAGTLTVGGMMDAYQLTAQEGTIVLNGEENDLDVLELDGGAVQLGKSITSVDVLQDTANGGRVSVAKDGILEVTGTGGTLAAAQLNGPGTLRLAEGATLLLEDAALLNGVELELEKATTLTLEGDTSRESTAHRVSGLNGSGTLDGNGTAEDVGLTITEVGSFEGVLTGNGSLTVADKAAQLFTSDFSGGEGWNLTNEGFMVLDFITEGGANAPKSLGALTLGGDSVTLLNLNPESSTEGMLTLNSITVGQDADVVLVSTAAENIVREDTSLTIGSVRGDQPAGVITTLTPNVRSVIFMLLDEERSTLSVDAEGNLLVNLVTSRENKLKPLADNSNSAAGAGLLWNAAFNGNTAKGTDIRRLLERLSSTTNRGEANRILAAASGASAAVLSSAFSQDVERQLRGVRNRMSMLPPAPRRAAAKGTCYTDAPRFAAWISGEGDHRKMKADGFMPGYSLTSWGGTLGMDVACRDNIVGGLALTAMYGDLDARSADNASGDFDRYYISAFTRVKADRWQHTLLGTVGRLDADLDRTVSYGTGSYRTHGDTKGWGYGLMYEIGYDLPMDEGARFTLEPVANVSWRYVDLDGYTEKGSDAALRVGDQTYNTVTFGAGVRTKAEVGECLFNRRALFEGRALVKVDVGDRKGEAAVAMLGGGGAWEKVRSAKLGAVGVELGAGLSIPLGDDAGALFIDGSAELRNEYSNLNGSVGYRFEF